MTRIKNALERKMFDQGPTLKLFQSMFHEALNGYSTVFVGAYTTAAEKFPNSRAQKVSDFADVRELSVGILGIVC